MSMDVNRLIQRPAFELADAQLRSLLDKQAGQYRKRAPMHRTPEQILADMQARYAQLEAEAESPQRKFPCNKCRHWGGFEYQAIKSNPQCAHPLIMGFDAKPVEIRSYSTSLCGPEKALWEPRLSLWARFWNWFLAPWMEIA